MGIDNYGNVMNHGDAINYIRILIFGTNVEMKNLETALFQIRIVNECLHAFFLYRYERHGITTCIRHFVIFELQRTQPRTK